MNIFEKLNKARELVRTTKHQKGGTNTYSNYEYFTPEQVEMIVAEVCKETKMLPLCNLKRNEHGLYQELVLVNLEDTKDSLTFELATVKGEMKATNDTQQMGGTDTYSERYIKMKVFQIKDNNLDPDSKDNSTKTLYANVASQGLNTKQFAQIRNDFEKGTQYTIEQWEKMSYEQKKILHQMKLSKKANQ